MDKVHKCPKCGEEENIHINWDYDYRSKGLPSIVIEDILCNECGTFWDPNEEDGKQF